MRRIDGIKRSLQGENSETDLISIREQIIRIKTHVMSLKPTVSIAIWELLNDGVESLISMIDQRQTITTVQLATVHPEPERSEIQNRRGGLKFTSTGRS